MGLVLLVLAVTVSGGHLSLAIYALSFWHYYLYGLAYWLGAVSLDVFKRDAVAMKAVSLIALGVVYLPAPPNLPSLAVVASGFLLNAVAARALGVDRTYYGHEVAGLPPQRITTFPYSRIAHPMLVGNIAAFGGTLINPDFRREWLPLALAHVTMNLGLLFMELRVRPQFRALRPGPTGEASVRPLPLWIVPPMAAAGGIVGWAAGSWGPWGSHPRLGMVMGAGISAHAVVSYLCYSWPARAPDEGREVRMEHSP
jgi:Phospholipid methyltransferase